MPNSFNRYLTLFCTLSCVGLSRSAAGQCDLFGRYSWGKDGGYYLQGKDDSLLRFSFLSRFFIALVCSGAQDQLVVLDILRCVAVFLLGFGAEMVKNILVQQNVQPPSAAVKLKLRCSRPIAGREIG